MAIEWKWLRGDLDDPEDVSTFAALKVILNNQIATRLYDRIAGGERDAIHVPLYPLALGIAENWWSLLYEPRKSDQDHGRAEVRHSLDAYMAGYVFPALTLWSAGNNAITVEAPNISHKFSNLEFLPVSADQTFNFPRAEVENDLFTLVDSVLGRVSAEGPHAELHEPWNRVQESLGNQEELQYCVAAGQLGIDPYDADGLDIATFANGLSKELFSDICEAATPDELPAATEWVRESERSMGEFPEIDIGAFGVVPDAELRAKVWDSGYAAARMLRRNLNLEGLDPRPTVDTIFGAAVRSDAPKLVGTPPVAFEGVAGRTNGTLRVAIPGLPARLRRYTLCRAAYHAWRIADGGSAAVTTAATLEQQVSRAFAAEMLAPAEWLKERAGSKGLTPSDVESIAEENVCPGGAVIWQAKNNGIPLRGIQLPT